MRVVIDRTAVQPGYATRRNKMGISTTPSVVSFERVEGGEEGEVTIKVGEEAREQAVKNPTNTYASVKRLIGRSCKEASGAVADTSQLKLLVESGKGDAHLDCEALGRGLAPEEISCHVIRTLLQDVERELGGEKVTRAVITVPAYFNDKQRRATEAAGLLAGLERVKLLREPEAAALAYGLDKLEDELILVFDLGGGTFDVSVLEVGGGIIEVLWTGGDAFLGGDDFDLALASWLVEEVIDSASSDSRDISADALKGIKRNKEVMSRVLAEARKAKVRLSSARSARVVVADVLPGLDLNISVTQRQLEQRCAKLLQLLAQPIRQVALMAGIELQGDDTALEQLATGTSPAVTDAQMRASQGGELSDLDLKALKTAQKSGTSTAQSFCGMSDKQQARRDWQPTLLRSCPLALLPSCPLLPACSLCPACLVHACHAARDPIHPFTLRASSKGVLLPPRRRRRHHHLLLLFLLLLLLRQEEVAEQVQGQGRVPPGAEAYWPRQEAAPLPRWPRLPKPHHLRLVLLSWVAPTYGHAPLTHSCADSISR